MLVALVFQRIREIAIPREKGREIVESHAVLAHNPVRGPGYHLPQVERLTNDEMMNGVRAAKVKTEQLERRQKPGFEYLGLLQHVADTTVIMHIGRHEVQATRTDEVRND